jgi:hypothetical protein
MANKRSRVNASNVSSGPGSMKGRVGEEAPGSLASASGATGAPESRGDTPGYHPGEETPADRNKKPVGRRPHQGHLKPEG